MTQKEYKEKLLQLEKLLEENKELKRKLKVADELNKQQYDLIINLSRQIRGYEIIGKADKLPQC